jgi:hypothetical protein
MTIRGTDHKGNAICLRVTRKRHNITEVWLHVQLDDGSVYLLPGMSKNCSSSKKHLWFCQFSSQEYTPVRALHGKEKLTLKQAFKFNSLLI